MARFGGDWARFMALFFNRGECNLLGYRGSGKSLLGYAILQEALRVKRIDGVAANCGVDLPIINWREILPPNGRWPALPRGSVRCGYYLDEAGSVLDNRNFATNPTQLGRYIRKFRMLIVYMSATPIDKRFTQLQVTPAAKLGPRWEFKWELLTPQSKVSEEGNIILYNPASYYGKFDTDACPVDDGGLINLFEWTLAWRLRNAPPDIAWFDDEDEDADETGEPDYFSTEAPEAA